jgi:hypothetical protein
VRERDRERFPLQLLRVLEVAALVMRRASTWRTTMELREAFVRESASSYCERTTRRDLQFLEALGCVESRPGDCERTARRDRRPCLEWRWRPGANLLVEAAATTPAKEGRAAKQ